MTLDVVSSDPEPGTPTIVVVACDRPLALARLLGSLDWAHYAIRTRLVISVDGGEHEAVLRVAEDFAWNHGEKQVLRREQRMGLRSHVLACGDLVESYGSIVMLEDDLFVSRYFHDYARLALHVYGSDSRVAGIALYAQAFNETAGLPFTALDDGSSVFFSKVACSWGQAWSTSQWRGFRTWLRERDGSGSRDDGSGDAPEDDPALPPNVKAWAATSWKKDFIAYLVATNRYFAYPRVSLSTNFGDVGTHHTTHTHLFQVPLQMQPVAYRFPKLDESRAVYDAYWEMESACLRRLCPALPAEPFLVDLYGQRNLRGVAEGLILTSREVDAPLNSFGRSLRPHEANVVLGVSGKDLRLGQRDHCSPAPLRFTAEHLRYHQASMLVAPTRSRDLLALFSARLPWPARIAMLAAARIKSR